MRRILAVNMISIGLLATGLLYLGEYRRGLVENELRIMTSQADLLSLALSLDPDGAVPPADGEPILRLEQATQLLRRLTDGWTARVRVFAPDGGMALDSRTLAGPGGAVEVRPLPPPGGPNLPDRVFGFLLALFDGAFHHMETLEPYREAAEQRAADYAEVEGALKGTPGQAVRSLRDGGLILSVALPVRHFKRVVGVVFLSADSTEIDRAVRAVRLGVLVLCAGALLVTALLSAYLARSMAGPIRLLAATAEKVRSTGADRVEIPDLGRRNDEIGDLSVALRRMTQALRERMGAIERFAADVSHEIKNPLASLRSAIETVSRLNDPAKQRRLMGIVLNDVQRLDKLITDISDASRLDAELSRALGGPVDMGAMAETLVDMERRDGAWPGSPGRERLTCEISGAGPFLVYGVDSRLAQVLRNLLSNAFSFTPEEGGVRVTVTREVDTVVLRVEDEGPGITAGKEEAIFDRFYSERSGDERSGYGGHSGLGLSISRQIAEAHGGRLTAANLPEGGAVFEMRLPAEDPC